MVASQVLARGTLLDVFVETLDAELELPEVSFPDFTANTPEQVEQAAEGSRDFWGLGHSGPILNMTRVAENAGAIVSYFGGVSDRVDALSMDRRRPFILRSEAKPSACRLRFDIAHECGHLIMHRGVLTGDKATEDQANRFASAFLLPRRAFLAEFPRSRNLDWSAIFDLKLRWKVSARAIIRRAYDLGILSSDQYRTGNIHLNKTGQSKKERYDGIMPPEAPELLETSFQALEFNRPGAVASLAERVGFGAAMFEVILGRSFPAPGPSYEGSNVYRLFADPETPPPDL
jgi:Zn-dependent peptidase ImmA (M78 family)